MTLKEKFKWEGDIETRLKHIREAQDEIASGKAERVTYYWFVGQTAWYAVEAYLAGNQQTPKVAAEMVVRAAVEYLYGDWRNNLQTPEGKTGIEAWKPHCLWYDEVMESLPFAAALSDWEAMKRIAAYPPENKLPEAAKAKGETAWGWALISFLRDAPRKRVEEFLAKAESDKAKRPKLLCPVLRALLDNDCTRFEQALLDYLTYYRKNEFKRIVGKIMSLEGTTLYHLGRKQGCNVNVPESMADHIIRLG
jgi:hypothetical protein